MTVVLDIARSHLGEQGGDQWWARECPRLLGLPWAAPFVLAVVDEAGHDSRPLRHPDMPYHVPAMRDTATKNLMAVSTIRGQYPMRGDIVITSPQPGAAPDMVGILQYAHGGTLYLIGGNIVTNYGSEVGRYRRPAAGAHVFRTWPLPQTTAVDQYVWDLQR